MKYEYSLIIRLLLCFVPLQLFYIILTPLTIYSTYFLLSPFNPVLIGNSISISSFSFDFVRACIAGAAYYLILLLVLLTKDIKLKLRLKLIGYGFLAIFVMNVLRVLILVYLAVNFGHSYFEAAHLIFWKFVSAIYVALVWIYLVKKFKVNSIPIYDDLKHLYKKSIFKN